MDYHTVEHIINDEIQLMINNDVLVSYDDFRRLLERVDAISDELDLRI